MSRSGREDIAACGLKPYFRRTVTPATAADTSAPTFGPLGPWLVTPDELGDVQNLPLWLELNGKRIQDSSTSDMIFPIKMLVSYISQFVVLEAGDVITTGTPPGVGLGMKPEQYLKAGDVMKLSVAGLGVQEQIVARWDDQ